jgi:hypothetical protein
MMGRPKNGNAPVPLPVGYTGLNDFDYSAPNASDACPLQSHIRRANPRDGRRYTPRILRRGMSYGPQSTENLSTERGVVFMAYCASLAEQFETIQRWVAGSNSTGASSAQADPFLRVPQQGENHTFRYVKTSHNVTSGISGPSVQRAVFDDKPLVQLEWGLYTFVPSLAVLEKLGNLQREPSATERTAGATREVLSPEDIALEDLRQELEDKDRAPLKWKEVREGGNKSPNPTSYGRLIGTCSAVLAALKDRSATQFSVKGYGERMTASVGLNHLGEDWQKGNNPPHPVNAAIEAIGEQTAFELTQQVVERTLKRFQALPATATTAVKRRPLDLVTFSDLVMAELCNIWIGLPDSLEPERSIYMEPGGRQSAHQGSLPRCPGNFASASRYIFSPYPRQAVVDEGQKQGKAVHAAVLAWLKGGGPLGTLAISIQIGLGGATVTPQILAPHLAGILLGFPPTVQGNFIKTIDSWIETGALWELQQALAECAPQGNASYAQTNKALRTTLLGTMRKRPVPEMLWRSPVEKDGRVNTETKHRVVLGIKSALIDDTAPSELLFGRDASGAAAKTAHGCPGMDMAMGVLLAMFAGLLQAGTLRPTGSPTLLILTQPT